MVPIASWPMSVLRFHSIPHIQAMASQEAHVHWCAGPSTSDSSQYSNRICLVICVFCSSWSAGETTASAKWHSRCLRPCLETLQTSVATSAYLWQVHPRKSELHLSVLLNKVHGSSQSLFITTERSQPNVVAGQYRRIKLNSHLRGEQLKFSGTLLPIKECGISA